MNNRLRILREERELRQVDVAQRADVVLKMYRRYECHNMLPNVLTAIRIADALEIRDLREIWQEET
jgi:hypothetical protein